MNRGHAKHLVLSTIALALFVVGSPSLAASPAEDSPAGKNSNTAVFEPADVFQLEFAADPQISPDGKTIVYARRGFDIQKDRTLSELWTISTEKDSNERFDHRPLGAVGTSHASPRWSADGRELVYLARDEGTGGTQIHRMWLDTGQSAVLTRLEHSPSAPSWSPDGQWIAFTSFVPAREASPPSMPKPPKGAEWAPAPKYIDSLIYRRDGGGFTEPGHQHVFVVPKSGGTPRQVTSGDFNHGSVSWTPDGRQLLLSANRTKDWEYNGQNSEVHLVDVASGEITTLTDRFGPDASPTMSPDGKRIAYLGYDDRYLGFQVTELYVMDHDGQNKRRVDTGLDRSVGGPVWDKDSRHLWVQYSDQGNGKIARVDTRTGKTTRITGDLGGLSLGRPYGGGAFSVSANGVVAFTHTRPDHPSDLAVVRSPGEAVRLTRLNDDLFAHKELAKVEEIWFESSHDSRRIQGWIATPPGFDPEKKYPLLLEIHGGPFSDYGDRFAAEIQLYAAAGYIVLYTNPRGSSSYGAEFGNLIHHAYPSHDYDDLMSGVDAVIAQGSIDEERLFVTGGSGGGVLTSWIVGHTERFAGAAVQKPVINWYSWALTADIATTYKYWFPGVPWEHLEHYMERSPISYVGNVTTPTLVITGEVDYRTPMSESEQYYQALKIQKVPSALVRIPEASHGIAARPSHLIGKVAYILDWFARSER